MEVTALPLNNTPFLNQAQWHTMTHWLPEDLWKDLAPQTAVQNDVNGFPRAGAKELLDRGEVGCVIGYEVGPRGRTRSARSASRRR